MDLKVVRDEAKKRLSGYCRVCPVCDGRVCAGEVPGMGGAGTGNSFKANLEALNKYKLNMRTIHPVKEVDTNCSILGLKLGTPVLAAPMTGTPYNMGGAVGERQFIGSIVTGSRKASSIGFTGDGADPTMYDSGIEAIIEEKGWGIAIIKPRSQNEVIARIRRAEEAGVAAVGVDIDGAGLVTMALKGQPVEPKTKDEIKKLVSATKLPFILKGIMTVDEAEMAVEAGVAAIVVSNHGGRILDHTPGAAEVLPDIAKAVGDRITVLADGGVRSGVDVLKLLALGAKAVLIGRPLVVGAFGGDAEGVSLIINKYTSELSQAMLLTGCPSLEDVSTNILYHR